MSKAQAPFHRAVFVVANPSHFPEMHRTASAMLIRKQFAPLIMFVGDGDFSREYGICKEGNIACSANPLTALSLQNSINIPQGPANGQAAGSVQGGISGLKVKLLGIWKRCEAFPLVGSLMNVLREHYLDIFVSKTSPIRLPWYMYQLLGQCRYARKVIDEAKPDVLIFPSMDASGILRCFAHEARSRGLSCVVIPYAWILRAELLSAVNELPQYQIRNIFSKWIAQKYPHWVYRGCFSRPAVEVAAVEMMGIGTKNPWMPDADADAVFLESESMLQSYVADGVPENKCWVTGNSSQDIMFRASQENNPSFHAKGEEYILSFLPPDQTGNQMSGFVYPSYWDMIIFWITTLTTANAIPVIFSLHPRMKNLKSRLLERFPEIKIYDGDSCELIPNAKFCVGTIGGSLRYAAACAKPVLYYDVFNYRMNEFSTMSSVIVVQSSNDFQMKFREFLSGGMYMHRLQLAALAAADSWGKLDGEAAERIEKLIFLKIKPLPHN